MRRVYVWVCIPLILIVGCSSAESSATRTSTSVQQAPAPSGTGHSLSSVVTGFIDPCVGIGVPRGGTLRRFPFAAGTVTALHGVERFQRVSPDEYRTVFPTDVVARQHVNQDQAFHFVLLPGRYVVTGIYDGAGRIPQTFFDVTVPRAGGTVRENLRSFCK